jgi:four helix bundle protein
VLGNILARQLLRSATSIGANYREANRGVSRADFANKIGTVQKETSETQYWIELLIDSGISANDTTESLHKEASELLAISSAIGKRLKQ